MRNFLAFVLALLLAGAAVVVIQKRQAEELADAEHARELESERPNENEDDANGDGEDDARVPPAATLAPKPGPERRPSRSPPEPARASPLPSTLSGTVVVVDEHGG